MRTLDHAISPQEIRIPCEGTWLHGDLALPAEFIGIVLFAHGRGSGRHSARSRQVAQRLQDAGIATLLFDLLTTAEVRAEGSTRQHGADIALLTRRLELATAWASAQPAVRGMPLGLVGAGIGSAAALIAAAQLGPRVAAVVSRCGRPDLAGPAALAAVAAPTLLIVGSQDPEALAQNEQAMDRLECVKRLAVVPRAGPRLEEPGVLDQVSDLAAAWFSRYLLRTEQLA